MRRLLQKLEDGLYYQGRGTWTPDPENALVFDKTSNAVECWLHEHLPPVQLVLKFEDSVFDIRLPCRTSVGHKLAAGNPRSRHGHRSRVRVN